MSLHSKLVGIPSLYLRSILALFQLKSCLSSPECVKEYSSLFSGEILQQVYLQIDPEPSFHITKLAGLEDQALILGRVKNFDAIIKNVKSLYEEELGMTLLVVPECICLGKTPESREGLENMKLLILLLLGAAVQCPNKETFITRIKELDVELQHNIVECIKQVSRPTFFFTYCVLLQNSGQLVKNICIHNTRQVPTLKLNIFKCKSTSLI